MSYLLLLLVLCCDPTDTQDGGCSSRRRPDQTSICLLSDPIFLRDLSIITICLNYKITGWDEANDPFGEIKEKQSPRQSMDDLLGILQDRQVNRFNLCPKWIIIWHGKLVVDFVKWSFEFCIFTLLPAQMVVVARRVVVGGSNAVIKTDWVRNCI